MKILPFCIFFLMLVSMFIANCNSAEPNQTTWQIFFSNDFNGELEPCG